MVDGSVKAKSIASKKVMLKNFLLSFIVENPLFFRPTHKSFNLYNVKYKELGESSHTCVKIPESKHPCVYMFGNKSYLHIPTLRTFKLEIGGK